MHTRGQGYQLEGGVMHRPTCRCSRTLQKCIEFLANARQFGVHRTAAVECARNTRLVSQLRADVSTRNYCSRRCRLGRSAANSRRRWPKCAHTLPRKKMRCRRWTKRVQRPCASCAALCAASSCAIASSRICAKNSFSMEPLAKNGRPLDHQGQASGQSYGRNARTCKLPARIQ